MPKVSICVPVHNVEPFIEKCSTSIFEQTLSDIEFVFVDDCSTDKSFEILNKVVTLYPHLSGSIHLSRLTRNQGPGIARNTAALMASGNYLYFPDADDYLEPDMLKLMYDKAIEEDADVVLCNIDVITADGIEVSSKNNFRPAEGDWMKSLLGFSPQALWWRLIKREIFLKAMESTDLSGIVRYEDLLMCIKCHYYAKKVAYIPQIVYHKINLNYNSVTHIYNKAAMESPVRVGAMIESFYRQVNIYKQYEVELTNFRYKTMLPFISKPEYWDPDGMRDFLQSINPQNLSFRFGSILFRFYILIIHHLIVGNYDKTAFFVVNVSRFFKFTKPRFKS